MFSAMAITAFHRTVGTTAATTAILVLRHADYGADYEEDGDAEDYYDDDGLHHYIIKVPI